MLAAAATGISATASPALAQIPGQDRRPLGTCSTSPSWRWVTDWPLEDSGGAVIQVYRGGSGNNSLVIRFARGPASNITVLGSEVGPNAQFPRAYGSTTVWGTYPRGWCPGESQGTQIRAAVTYLTDDRRIWTVIYCNSYRCGLGPLS